MSLARVLLVGPSTTKYTCVFKTFDSLKTTISLELEKCSCVLYEFLNSNGQKLYELMLCMQDDKSREATLFTGDMSTAEQECILEAVGLSIQYSSYQSSVVLKISTRFHVLNELSKRAAFCSLNVDSYPQFTLCTEGCKNLLATTFHSRTFKESTSLYWTQSTADRRSDDACQAFVR